MYHGKKNKEMKKKENSLMVIQQENLTFLLDKDTMKSRSTINNRAEVDKHCKGAKSNQS